MEHFWSPFFIFLAALVTAVFVPLLTWKLAQIKERRAREDADEDEERDFQLECYLWKQWHTNTNDAFRLLFQGWLEGRQDLTMLMATLDLAFKNYPKPPDKPPH